jgi:hypothetical protein
MYKVLVNLIFNALYPWPQAHRFTILDTLLVKWLMDICFMSNDTVSNTDWVFDYTLLGKSQPGTK